MNALRRPVVLFRRPVRAFLILGSGFTAWGAAFLPFIEEVEPLKAMPFLGVYAFALSWVTIGILLQVRSRLYWAWLLSLAALLLTLLAVTIVYGGAPELLSIGAIQWIQIGVYSLLSLTVLLSARGWLTVWTRKSLRAEDRMQGPEKIGVS